MEHYWKIKCPVCGAETIWSTKEDTQVHCSHFSSFFPEKSLVIYYNDLGEEVAVSLESVGQVCYNFSCPLCKEEIEACATEGAHQYFIKTNCTHFVSLQRGEGDKISAIFADSYNNIYPMEIG